MILRILPAALLILVSAAAMAADQPAPAPSGSSGRTVQYISDRLALPMRSGQSVQHRILKMIPSGTAVNVLKTDGDSGWSEIKTDDGTEGWVPTRYLMQTPSARDQLAAAQQTATRVEIENGRLKKELADLRTQAQSSDHQVKQLQQDKQDLGAEVNRIRQTAGNALAIDNENKTLKTQLLTQERETQALRQENEMLKDRSKRDWFVAGGGVLIAGILLGLILPRIRMRRKSGWSDF